MNKENKRIYNFHQFNRERDTAIVSSYLQIRRNNRDIPADSCRVPTYLKKDIDIRPSEEIDGNLNIRQGYIGWWNKNDWIIKDMCTKPVFLLV